MIDTIKHHFEIYIIGALLLVWYGYQSSTYIGFGDSLGFLWAATDQFQTGTNATCHFLYVNLLHILYKVFPGANAFSLFSWVSIFSALGCLVGIYIAQLRILNSKVAALYGLLTLAFAFTFWRQVEIIEVYCSNLCIVTLLLIEGIKCVQNKNYNAHRWSIVLLFLGISLWVHIQNILLIPAFGLLSIYRFQSVTTLIRTWTYFSVCFIGLFIVPFFTGEHSFLAVITENEHFLQRAIDHNLSYYVISLAKNIGYFVYNFHIHSGAILFGIVALFKQQRQLCMFLMLVMMPYLFFPVFYNVPDNYVFALNGYVVCAIFAGYGLNKAIQIQKFGIWKQRGILSLALFGIIFYYTITQISKYTPLGKQLQEQKAYKGGIDYLLWPGMRKNVSLVALAKQIDNTGQKPMSFDEYAWNYEQAQAYIKWCRQNGYTIYL